MWKTVFVIIVMCPFFALGASESAPLDVPSLYVGSEGGNHYIEEISESQKCNVLLSKVSKVIDFANAQFENRRENWPPEFLAERSQIAKKYSKRSKYIVVRKGNVAGKSKKDPVVGTLGITYATYDAEDLAENKLNNLALDLIPVEETLGLDPLPRPLDSTGKGIIFELRTYAKDKISGQTAFPKLLQGAFNLVFRKIKDFPELYDKPILYLYADDLSVRFYTHFGFHVNEEIAPVIHDGVSWRVMSASPKDIEAVSGKLSGFRFFENLNQPYVAISPNGKPFRISPHTSFAIDENNVAMKATTMDELEIMPGIFAAENSQFIWRGSVHWSIGAPGSEEKNQISGARIDKLSRPVKMDALDTMIPAGATIHINGKGAVVDAFFLPEPIYIEKLGVTVAKNGSISVSLVKRHRQTPREEITVGPLSRRVMLAKGLWVPKGAEVTWIKSPNTNKFRFLRQDNSTNQNSL